MSNRISRSWELGKASWQVLKQDKRLMVFPVLSAIACLVVIASFAIPLVLTADFEAMGRDSRALHNATHQVGYYAVLFAFYFVNYAVIAFFNAALIGCAMRRFEGEDAGVGVGLKIAMSRLPQILGWSLVSATVGVVLRAIAERSGIIGRIVISLVGFVWSVATYFVVPVLVVEGVGPIEAIKRSAGVIRKTWGESLVTNLGLGAVSFVGFLLALVPLAAGIGLTIATASPWPAVAGGAIALGMLIAVALVTSTLKMILVAALYRFAATGLVPDPFDAELLRQTFRSKKK